MKYFQPFAVLCLLFLPISSAFAQDAITVSPTTTNPYGYGSTPTVPMPGATPNTTPTSSFPSFPSNPAQSLLPSWSVGNTGSTSYSGTGMNGGSYSGTSTFGNTYNSSGYNFPNQTGSCGVGAYVDVVGGKSGANSASTSADLNANAMAGRVGISISSQQCIDYAKIEKQRSETEIGKTKAQEEGLTKRRCVEAITETGKLPVTPQSKSAMDNLMTICTPLLKG